VAPGAANRGAKSKNLSTDPVVHWTIGGRSLAYRDYQQMYQVRIGDPQ